MYDFTNKSTEIGEAGKSIFNGHEVVAMVDTIPDMSSATTKR